MTTAMILSALTSGLLSGYYGRKSILITGQIVTTFACFLLMQSENISTTLCLFTIIGLGLGSCNLFRSIIRDAYRGFALRNMAATISTVLSISSALSPLLGGILLTQFNLQTIFLFLACSNLCVGINILFNPLHNPKQSPRKLLSTIIVKNANTQNFLNKSYCSLMTLASYVAWTISLPVLLINYLAWTPESYGLIFLLISGSSQIGGACINHYLIQYIKEKTLLNTAWMSLLSLSISMLVCQLYWGIQSSWLLIHLECYFFAMIFTWSNLMSNAFEEVTIDPGLASGIYGGISSIGAAIGAFICSITPQSNAYGLIGILIVCNVASLVLYNRTHTQQTQPSINA